MDCSTPGLPVLRHLPESAQTHVHCVSDAIQPSRLCHPLFLSSFPASGSFPTSQLFASGGKSIGASASVLVLSKSIQDWFPLGLTDLISLQSKGLSRLSSPTPQFRTSVLQCSAFFMVQFSHSYVTTGKTIALTIQTFVGKVMSLLFNTLSRFLTAFLLRSKQFQGCSHSLQWFCSPGR